MSMAVKRRLAVTITAIAETPDDNILCFPIAEALTEFLTEPHVRNGWEGGFIQRYVINGQAIDCRYGFDNQYLDANGNKVDL